MTPDRKRPWDGTAGAAGAAAQSIDLARLIRMRAYEDEKAEIPAPTTSATETIGGRADARRPGGSSRTMLDVPIGAPQL